MDESANHRIGRAFRLQQLAVVAGLSMVLALGLSSCTNVAGFSPTSLVRVVDASYIAPAVNVYVENTLFAGNIGQGYISNYGTVTPSPAAQIKVTRATGGGVNGVKGTDAPSPRTPLIGPRAPAILGLCFRPS